MAKGSPRTPTPLDQSGRGLQIVQALAEDWGIVRSPNGKLVWFTLRLRADADEHKSRSTASSEKAPEQSHPSKPVRLTTTCRLARSMGVVRPLTSWVETN
ncbi:MAG: ATP-binding protein [Solirubrobacteraceae bacterium]|jgi:hypothetical protein